MAIGNNGDHIRVLLDSYYTTIRGWGVHLECSTHTHTYMYIYIYIHTYPEQQNSGQNSGQLYGSCHDGVHIRTMVVPEKVSVAFRNLLEVPYAAFK